MPNELAVAKPGINAIVPSTVEQVDAFAKRLIVGKYPIPAWIKSVAGAGGSPEATVSTIILRGLSLGMEPFTALESFYEIKGRMGLYSSAMAASVLASGRCENWNVRVERAAGDDKVVAIVSGNRVGMKPFEVRYSWADAVQQGYTTTNPKYKTDPKAMLKARAIAIACRENFPDVLRGMNYAAEEIEDFKEADVVTTETPPVGEATQTRATRKKKDPAPEATPAPAAEAPIDATFTPPEATPATPAPAGDDDLDGMFQ